jgi:hypothetical protein
MVVIEKGGNQKPFWSPQGVLQLKQVQFWLPFFLFWPRLTLS